MDIVQLILIAVGLAMDAFAVSICKGLKMKAIDKKYTLIIAGFFGGFQALMPLVGWILGRQFQSYIAEIDHWVAFVLLGLIGGKMIFESFQNEEEEGEIKYDIKEVLVLAIATSIDALAVGITFAFFEVNICIAIILIGVITFFLSIMGVLMGNTFGMKYKNKSEFVGGVILILIGVKILLEHLNIL